MWLELWPFLYVVIESCRIVLWQGGGHEHEGGHENEGGHEHGGTEPMVIGVSFQRCAGGAHRPMGYSPEVESPKPPRALTYHGLLT